MIKKINVILLLLSGMMYSQDIVKLTNGAELDVKIISNNSETIAFGRGKSETPFYIAKSEIVEIVFQNGTVEKIEHPVLTIEQIKANVVRLADECAFTEKNPKKIKASFEGDYLRMKELDKKGNLIEEGLLFDLAKVYQFDPLSIRGDHAFINIWTDRIRWPEREGRQKMDKIKLVLRIYDIEKATLLNDALIQLNKALPKPKY
jgi:hypothetical protein